MNWVEIAGISLRYDLSGAGENTLVLVHEMGGSLETWDDVIEPLAKRWRVLRYDTREAGFSEKTGRIPDIAAMSGELASLLDALGIRSPIAIVGCAIGAAIAIHFATNYPQRTAAMMALSPATGIAASGRAAAFARAEKAEREGMRSITDALFDMAYPPALRKDVERYRAARARLLGADPASFALIYRMLADLDLTLDFAKVRCPTLVVAGAHDQLRPPDHVRAIAAQIPCAQFEVIEAGHYIPVQAPDQTVALLSGLLDRVGF